MPAAASSFGSAAAVIEIEAESYRLKEAKELNAARTKQRRTKKR